MFVNVIGNAEKEPCGRRYSRKMKSLCLSLQYASTKGYKVLWKILTLPSPRTLRASIECFDLEIGVSDTIIQMLKMKAQSMKDRDKLCVLALDEMHLKMHKQYDRVKDENIGVCDFRNGVRGRKLANHALVANLHGLMKSWRQPIGYVLTANAASDILLNFTKEIFEKVEHTGLRIKVIVCNQCGSNRGFYNTTLRTSPEKPYILKKDLIQIQDEVNDENIY